MQNLINNASLEELGVLKCHINASNAATPTLLRHPSKVLRQPIPPTPSLNGPARFIKYRGLHKFISNHKPKSEKCECCGKVTKKLDLANISGEYKRDINDYEWLCRKCHMTKDGRRKASSERMKMFNKDNDKFQRNAIGQFMPLTKKRATRPFGV